MTQLLAGKVAIITGGASGIGLATVEEFVAQGAKVILADIADGAGEAAAARLGDSVRYVHTDVSDESQVEAVVAAAVESFGKLDVMFNNAGANGDPRNLLEIDTTGFEKTLGLDVLSVVLGHKYAGRQFVAQGGGGSIISTASIAGLEGGWGGTMYTVAKHAVIGVVRAAVNDLSQYGIRSNAIAPGIVAAPSIASTFGVPAEDAEAFTDFLDGRLKSTQPLGRMGRGRDIADAAVYLASDLAKFVTGIVMPVDGGATAVTLTPAFQVAGQAAQDWAAGAR